MEITKKQIYKLKPSKNLDSYKTLIKYIEDRPGHDRTYSINYSKITKETGWLPAEKFESGIYKTIKWYIKNTE